LQYTVATTILTGLALLWMWIQVQNTIALEIWRAVRARRRARAAAAGPQLLSTGGGQR